MENPKFVGLERPTCSISMDRLREIILEVNETHKLTSDRDYLETKRTIYEVYGFGPGSILSEFNLYKGCHIVDDKYKDSWIIMGKFIVSHDGTYVHDYIPVDDDMRLSTNGHSLIDLNVFKENDYNQHRLFERHQDALEYVEHCKTDPAHYLLEKGRRISNEMWNEYDSHYDYASDMDDSPDPSDDYGSEEPSED